MSGGVQINSADCSPKLARLVLASPNCPAHARKALESVLARSGGQPLSGHGQGAENAPSAVLPPVRGIQKKSKGPNKTEMRFNLEILGGRGIFEGKSYALPGGSRYKPDWITHDDGVDTAWEVKGSYRFPSESGAVRGFRAARAAWPETRFRWAVWTGKEWIYKHEEK